MSSPLGILFTAKNESTNGIGVHKVYSGGDIEGESIGTKVKSLFGRSVFSPFPEEVDKKGNVTSIQAIRNVHSTETYDTSVSSLVKYTEGKRSQQLRFADFAYLKNLGVYPNNRLIIARRFPQAVGNNLNKTNTAPLATMISWFNEDDPSWFSLSYNEEWVEADADFTNVLNDMGNTFKLGKASEKNLGNFLGQGLDVLPFGRFSEPLQRLVFEKLGFVNDPYNLPLGNPNLIRQAKQRKLVSANEAESGLACEVSIKMEVEYEQKFINNVDPTIVYLDIIQNALTFGTSDAAFQMSGKFNSVSANFIAKLTSGNFGAIFEQLKGVVDKLFGLIKGFAQDVWDALNNPKKLLTTVGKIIDQAFGVVQKSIGAIVGKFKVKLIGILNALTGSPSCPWHITIGNPKRPFFCSGDMQLKEVSVEFGTTLAFNDLPSTIKFSLTFANARPLGANEIFDRLNTGKGRSYLRVHIEPSGDEKDVPRDDFDDIERLKSGSLEEASFDDKGGGGKGKTHSDILYSKLGSNSADWLPQYVAPLNDSSSSSSSKKYAEPEMPEPDPNELILDNPSVPPPTPPAPPTPPPSSFTFQITNIGDSWQAKIFNSGKLIDIRLYSTVAYTDESVRNDLVFVGQNFGFTGRVPPGPGGSIGETFPKQPDLR